MKSAMVHQPDTKIENYLPVYLDALRIDTILDFDLFLMVQDRMVLYREKNLAFTEESKISLAPEQVCHDTEKQDAERE